MWTVPSGVRQLTIAESINTLEQEMSGYARIDLRLAPDGAVYVLEANPNPDLQKAEDFAQSARAEGVEYPILIQRIVNLGLSYQAEWDTEEA